MLCKVVENFRNTLDDIEIKSVTNAALVAVAARIDLLAPVFSEMAGVRGDIVQRFQLELQALTHDLTVAKASGNLDKFFDTAIVQHNIILSKIIADSTLATVHEVHKCVEQLERSKLLQLQCPLPADFQLSNVTGGTGGPGGYAHMGGEGGEGEGPILDLGYDEHWKIGHVSGGIGGTGGTGVEVGGKGGTGRAPVFKIVRRD
ncbi:hypothetical protein C8R43DRAFT_1126283 [Mycena crocata]|nr:hypothetical protein C8R43DRAFT_1126283 [Mycena crocata]